jgi:thioredoxin 1
MATVDVTAETFEQTALDNDIVFIDFWADWCGPCRTFAPIYDKVSQEHDDIVFAKVDTEAEQALAATFNIRSIPTLMAVRDQVVVFSQPGVLPEAALEDLITQIKDLDMQDVHRQLAEHANGEHANGEHADGEHADGEHDHAGHNH